MKLKIGTEKEATRIAGTGVARRTSAFGLSDGWIVMAVTESDAKEATLSAAVIISRIFAIEWPSVHLRAERFRSDRLAGDAAFSLYIAVLADSINSFVPWPSVCAARPMDASTRSFRSPVRPFTE